MRPARPPGPARPTRPGPPVRKMRPPPKRTPFATFWVLTGHPPRGAPHPASALQVFKVYNCRQFELLAFPRRTASDAADVELSALCALGGVDLVDLPKQNLGEFSPGF